MGKKIIIIGGGPGGYAAAIRAAQLGADVILAEKAEIGGTCLNVGCIPTKALLHTAEFYKKLVSNSVAGVKSVGASLDWPAAQIHKAEVVSRLTGGVQALLRHNGVRVISESASLLSANRVKIGDNEFEADAVLLATGSENTLPPFPGAELTIESTAALALKDVPKSMVIIGGGVIGVELAALYGALGTQITILEMQPEILPQFDTDISAYLRETMVNDGVKIYNGAKLTEVKKSKKEFLAEFEHDGTIHSVTAQYVLTAVGRRPNTADLGLTELGIKLQKGAVAVNEYFETSASGVYAVGDCNGNAMLAHAAMAQGVSAAEHIMGVTPHYNAGIIPGCVYSSPEIASVGMTEKAVSESGTEYSIGFFSLENNGKAIIEGTGGFIKIIADKRLGEILGVHIIGPRATELIAEAALCMSMEGTVEDIVRTIHAHPTVSEAVAEAAMSVFGKPLHGI